MRNGCLACNTGATPVSSKTMLCSLLLGWLPSELSVQIVKWLAVSCGLISFSYFVRRESLPNFSYSIASSGRQSSGYMKKPQTQKPYYVDSVLAGGFLCCLVVRIIRHLK